MMIHKNRDNLFALLRAYHTETVLLKPSNTEFRGTIKDLSTLEDKIIGMVLGMANGKGEFIDFSQELKEFSEKNQAQPSAIKKEQNQKNMIAKKVEQLQTIVDLAKKSIGVKV